MDSKKKFNLFVKELKYKIKNEFKGKDKEKILEFMENYKYDYPEKLEKKNGNYEWLVEDPPVWFIFHCVIRYLKNIENNIPHLVTFININLFQGFCRWIYKKNLTNTANLIRICFHNYLGCDYLFFLRTYKTGEPKFNFITRYDIKLFSYPDEKGYYNEFVLIKRRKKEITCLN